MLLVKALGFITTGCRSSSGSLKSSLNPFFVFACWDMIGWIHFRLHEQIRGQIRHGRKPHLQHVVRKNKPEWVSPTLSLTDSICSEDFVFFFFFFGCNLMIGCCFFSSKDYDKDWEVSLITCHHFYLISLRTINSNVITLNGVFLLAFDNRCRKASRDYSKTNIRS